jgi:formylmethanofuran dehydrogenase subunit C
VVCCALVATVGALGDNLIYEWTDPPQGGYTIDQDNLMVEINAPGTYRFAASETTDPDNLGVINVLKIQDTGVQGTVNIYVTAPNNESQPGVARLKAINLSGATEGTIVIVRARDSLADDDKIVATNVTTWMSARYGAIVHDIELAQLDGSIWCPTMANLTVWGSGQTGSVTVVGAYAHTIEIDGPLSYLSTGDMSGTVNVHGDADELYFASVAADAAITVTGNLETVQSSPGGFDGYLHVTGDVAACTMPELGSAGVVTIDGDLTSYLYCEVLAGVLSILGDVNYNAMILTYPLTGVMELGSVQGQISVGEPTSNADLSGRLRVYSDLYKLTVDGNLTGELETQFLTGTVHVNGNLVDDSLSPTAAGHIIVNRSFGNGYGPGFIEVTGDFSWSQAFIAIDYDGWQEGDDWKDNAFIDVHGVRLTGNTPGEHVWEISPCRGDMNGDAIVGFGDINPFVAALSNPAQYAQMFPGLQGSMGYHGDTNCNGTFGFDDINPFVALLSLPDPPCSPDCSFGGDGGMNGMLYEGGEGLPELPAEELAAQLAANVWPELYPDLVAMVAANIDLQPDEESQAYWQAVYDALTQ